jgi:hypothetical protein
VPGTHQRLFNYIEDNAITNQLSASLGVGQEVDTGTKALSFVFCEPVSVANSWQNIPANPVEKLGR